ncbi:hypothetical protein ACEPAI_4024 [Sanghuangporus weigelae]
MIPRCLFTLILFRSLAATVLFAEDSLVKLIGRNELKAALKEKMTLAVAFVESHCSDCEALAPQYEKTALALYPFLPMYAVDCQESANEQLCTEQNVTTFPTVRLFPRGQYMDPKDFKFDKSEISATDLYYFAQRSVPDKIKLLRYFEDIDQINAKPILKKPRALLLKRTNRLPLLWSILANKYSDDIEFFSHRDWRGKSSVKLGLEAGEEGKSKVLIYPAGKKKPVQYGGFLKLDSLSSFFDSLLEGRTSIDKLNEKAGAEEFVPDPKLLEIEKQQELEMLKLAHGGFTDLFDFEAAIRDGSAKNFHGKQGYPGMMGGAVPKATGSQENTLQSNEPKMPVTDGAEQVVMTAATTGAATAAQSDNAARISQGNIQMPKDAVQGPTATSATERSKDEL